MKKLSFLFAGVIFMTTSSFTVETYTDCDALAAEWYYQTLAGGYGQSAATHAHDHALEVCWYNGGSSNTQLNMQ